MLGRATGYEHTSHERGGATESRFARKGIDEFGAKVHDHRSGANAQQGSADDRRGGGVGRAGGGILDGRDRGAGPGNPIIDCGSRPRGRHGPPVIRSHH